MQKQKTEKEDFRVGDILQNANKQTNKQSWIDARVWRCVIEFLNKATHAMCVQLFWSFWYHKSKQHMRRELLLLLLLLVSSRASLFSVSPPSSTQILLSLSTVYIRNQWFCTCLIVAAFVNPPSYPSTVLVCRPACPVSHRADYNIAIRTTPFLEFHNTTLSSPPLCAVRVVTLLRAHTQQAMILGRRRRWIVCKKRERWQ